jgi:hypothetical protein
LNDSVGQREAVERHRAAVDPATSGPAHFGVGDGVGVGVLGDGVVGDGEVGAFGSAGVSGEPGWAGSVGAFGSVGAPVSGGVVSAGGVDSTGSGVVDSAGIGSLVAGVVSASSWDPPQPTANGAARRVSANVRASAFFIRAN